MIDIEEVLIEHWEKLPEVRSRELEWHTIIEAMRDYGNRFHESEVKNNSSNLNVNSSIFCDYCGKRKRLKGDGSIEPLCTC